MALSPAEGLFWPLAPRTRCKGLAEGEATWPVLSLPGPGTGVGQHRAGSRGAQAQEPTLQAHRTAIPAPCTTKDADPPDPGARLHVFCLPAFPPPCPMGLLPNRKVGAKQPLLLGRHRPGRHQLLTTNRPASPAHKRAPHLPPHSLVGGGVSEREATRRPPHTRSPYSPVPGQRHVSARYPTAWPLPPPLLGSA